MSSAVSVAKDQWSAQGSQFTSYVADISKGVLIIVVGGLAVGVCMSLVSRLVVSGGRCDHSVSYLHVQASTAAAALDKLGYQVPLSLYNGIQV